MSTQEIAAALERVAAVLRRRPEAGVHEDAPAMVRWQGGTRMRSSHANGTEVDTDMPAELGGSGDHITPGWLFRAGLASCAATSITLAAAAEHIELTSLEVRAESRSDTRALIGLLDGDGQPVPPAPSDLQLSVNIAASNVPAELLRALVEAAVARSPIPGVVTHALPLALHIVPAGA